MAFSKEKIAADLRVEKKAMCLDFQKDRKLASTKVAMLDKLMVLMMVLMMVGQMGLLKVDGKEEHLAQLMACYLVVW